MIEKLLQKGRDKYKYADKHFFENNTALKGLREMEEERIEELVQLTKKDDLKELNQVDLKQFISKQEITTTQFVSEAPKMQEFADEKLMRDL